MPPVPPEPDKGTGSAGPLRRSGKDPAPADEGWITEDRSKPWLQRNIHTGRFRTNGYQPGTKL